MNDRDPRDLDIDQFMEALDRETPYEKAQFASERILWLKAEWAKQREQEQRTARIRLVLETATQALVGLAALLTGYHYWPQIQLSLIDFLATIPEPAAVYPSVVVITAALTLVISILGTRIMLRS